MRSDYAFRIDFLRKFACGICGWGPLKDFVCLSVSIKMCDRSKTSYEDDHKVEENPLRDDQPGPTRCLLRRKAAAIDAESPSPKRSKTDPAEDLGDASASGGASSASVGVGAPDMLDDAAAQQRLLDALRTSGKPHKLGSVVWDEWDPSQPIDKLQAHKIKSMLKQKLSDILADVKVAGGGFKVSEQKIKDLLGSAL